MKDWMHKECVLFQEKLRGILLMIKGDYAILLSLINNPLPFKL